MPDTYAALIDAWQLMIHGDTELLAIVSRSLHINSLATLLATGLALPLGLCLALGQFPGRRWLAALIQGLGNLPSVLIGFVVYLLLLPTTSLSATSVLVTVQSLLVLFWLADAIRHLMAVELPHYDETLRSFGLKRWQMAATLSYETRYRLLQLMLSGFARASGALGSLLIVSNALDTYPRLFTDSLVHASASGSLAFAMALALSLLGLLMLIQIASQLLRSLAKRVYAA